MPTTGEFVTIPVSAVVVKDRIREANDVANGVLEQERSLDSLARSIARHGQLNPITIDRDFVLVAGFRRLCAIQSLGAATITAQFLDVLSEFEREIVELEENIRRLDMTWEEKVKGVRAYHERQRALDPEWTQVQTSEALNISPPWISRMLAVAQAGETNPQLFKSTSIAAAYKRTVEAVDRGVEAHLADSIDVLAGTRKASDAPPIHDPFANFKILQTDFCDWAAQVEQPVYNLIHCDFPYGIGIDKSKTLAGKSHITGTYDDSAETYFRLLDCLTINYPNFLAPSGHGIFWLSMFYYAETLARLRAAKFTVSYMPLIWHKTDNSGIVPDPQRGPRFNYETALFFSWGDRKIVKPVNNIYGCPRSNDGHMSVKPQPMLQHFLSMLVDGHTRLLDPTCGAGSAIRACQTLGAASALGLELNPEFAKTASNKLRLQINKETMSEALA